MSASRIEDLNLDYKAKYGFHDPEEFLMKAPKGLSHEVVEMISRYKNEPDWMREFRHEALDIFYAKPMPRWGNSALLDAIDFDDIHYYLKSSAGRPTTGTTCPRTSRTPSTSWASPRPSRSSWPA